jgi:hypothetical protein
MCLNASNRFRPNLYTILASTLFKYMRAHSTTLRDATDEQLIANLKKFLVEQAATAVSSGEGSCAAGGRSAFGGKTSFSPKKPKPADSRPAVLARNGWVITIDRRRGIVTVGGVSFCCCAMTFILNRKKEHLTINFFRLL